MRTIMSVLLLVAISMGVAVGLVDASSAGSPPATASIIRTAHVDLSPDAGPATPGPTDPNGPLR
jgi:hypothetical protein